MTVGLGFKDLCQTGLTGRQDRADQDHKRRQHEGAAQNKDQVVGQVGLGHGTALDP